MNLFLSYNLQDEPFIQRVSYYLKKQKELIPYCYADERHQHTLLKELATHLNKANAFLLFLGQQLGKTQEKEILFALTKKKKKCKLLIIELPGFKRLPP